MQKKPLIVTLTIIILVGAIITGALTLRPSSPPTTDTLTIVSSANFWGDIARKIGGDHVTVTSILDDPEADPHLYESGAKDASHITSADVVIANGLGYDDFIDTVLATAPRDGRTFIKAATAMSAPADANPHLWYDLPHIPRVAIAIEAALSQKDPAHKADYQKNLADFTASLQPALDKINEIRARHASAPVAYTERVPEYLLQAAGLKVVSPASFAAAIEEGTEPSPADQTVMRNLIADKKIRVLLYNNQAESPVTQDVKELAIAAGIPVVGVGETVPQDTTFVQWQRTQLDALATALNNNE